MSMLSDLFKRVRGDEHFRIKLILCLSCFFNFVYSCFLLAVSRIYFSRWFLVMSVYYGMLCIARFSIFLQVKSEKSLFEKIITMRRCGYFLLLLNLAASVMMLVLIYQGQYVKHHEITVITLATYTFASLTFAIIGSIRQFRKNDRIYFGVKVISLVSACVSIVNLTNTMLATFGSDKDLLRRIILPILSGVVSIFIVLSAVFMILKANSDLRILKNEKERQ